MEISGEGVSVYAEAKGEYTKQLCQYMVPALQQYFLDMLEEARLKDLDPKKILITFQSLLEGIRDWNVDKVQRETGTVSAGTHCDYLEELITAVFIAHTKVLSAIRLTTKQKKLHITIPKLDHFIHRTMTECARILWSNTYLFAPSVPSIERQKNMRLIETLLNDGVLQSIRGMLPVKNILREYLKDDDSEDEQGGENTSAEPPVVPVVQPQEAVVSAEETSEVPASAEQVGGAIASAPPSENAIVFSGIDTLFQADTSHEADIHESDFESESEFDEEDDNGDIKIIDSPPEPLDGFEDIDHEPSPTPSPAPAAVAQDDILDMDFEELS